MLMMTSIIRVGQSKFVTVQIDEDSNERIMNCIQTLSELEAQPAVHEVFLEDTKMAFSKMLGAQEVCFVVYLGSFSVLTWMFYGLETCVREEGSRNAKGSRYPS
jgi:vesicle coat complex subunit